MPIANKSIETHFELTIYYYYLIFSLNDGRMRVRNLMFTTLFIFAFCLLLFISNWWLCRRLMLFFVFFCLLLGERVLISWLWIEREERYFWNGNTDDAIQFPHHQRNLLILLLPVMCARRKICIHACAFVRAFIR